MNVNIYLFKTLVYILFNMDEISTFVNSSYVRTHTLF